MQTKTKIIVSSITILIITIFVFLFYKSRSNILINKKDNIPVVVKNPKIQQTDKISTPVEENKNNIQIDQLKKGQQSDFNNSNLSDFPTDIPIEKGVKIEQSYSVNYDNQKQLLMVFLSSKTIKENYLLYADFLKNKTWEIVNNFESGEVSSIYAKKDGNEINIAITGDLSSAAVKSRISISIIKK